MIKAERGDVVVVRFQDGEQLPEGLERLGLKSAAILGGVGMLRDLVLAYWDGERYLEEPVEEPVELLSLQGNIGDREGEVVVHVHVVAGKRGGAAVGGHLRSATVHNTAELVLLKLTGIRMARKPEPTGLVGLHPESDGRASD
ncbi:DNA-binding protein [Candidatus Acetothermia bacterium]|nr:MAG: DNA-binding protein [Candidatus Acetothermia bacterium]